MDAVAMNPTQAGNFADRCRRNLDAFDSRWPKALRQNALKDFPKSFPDGRFTLTLANGYAFRETERRLEVLSLAERYLRESLELASRLAGGEYADEPQEALNLTREAFVSWNGYSMSLRDSTNRLPLG